jgi:DNA-binding IclR family transcriptional regulator
MVTKGKNIQSIQRALDIVDCFDENNIEMSLKEITERVGLNKSTVHGIINTLHNNRYLLQNSNGNYMLGPALFNKSIYATHASKVRLRTISKGYMARISNKYKCTSHIFTLEGNRLRFQDMTTPINSYYMISTVLNDLMHLYCTASGKILLSYMSLREREDYLINTEFVPYTDKTRTTREAIVEDVNRVIERGYSTEIEEVEEGCISIAVPILTKNEELFGTISITGSKIKISGKINDIVADLKDTSIRISKELF